MSTLIVALIVILNIAVVLFLLIFLHNRQHKKKTGAMLRRFSELGSEYNMSFTVQEGFRNSIIGVDGIKGKLLFLERNNTVDDWSLIDLTEAKSCGVQKMYGSIGTENAAAKSMERYLQATVLEFNFKNSNHTVALPFYKLESNSIQEVPQLEAKAKNRVSVLLKMMTKEMKRA